MRNNLQLLQRMTTIWRERREKGMKVLLAAINAKYIHSNLAVFSLKKYAQKYKECISIGEYTINQYVDEILMDIYKQKPDILALSCYIWNIDMVKKLTKELKKICPKLPIWVGGPEVSYEVETFLNCNPQIDGVMIGEGEQTFLELMEYYIDGIGNLENIAGIAYRKQQDICFSLPRKPMDISEIPFPYDDINLLEHKIIYYETSRGCPFSCSYCLSSIEKGVRLRNMELVKKELQLFLDYKVPQVKFIDRTFNCNHKHAMEIWKYLLEHDNGVTNFHFEISADLLNEEELALMSQMRVGLIQLEIGVQSTNPATIQEIHRKMDLEKLKNTVEKVKQFGNIHQHLDLIAGLPYEDYESFRNSFDQVYGMEPEQLQLGFLKVLKGSRMHQEYEENGIKYRDYAPYEVLATKWLPFSDVLRLKRVEDMVEVYYNSGQFVHSLRYLMHHVSSPFDFYQQLGDYYEERQIVGFVHARIERYNILLEFVKEKMPECAGPLCELLVYDLYLRENMKTRPSFGENLETYKDAYYDFFKDAQQKNKEGEKNVLWGYREYQARQMARMTHVEHFNYDIEELEKSGRTVLKESHVLFDYKNRHPLTMEAMTTEISI